MAKESQKIRERARLGLELLLEASQATDDREADRRIREAFTHLEAAAGVPLRERDYTAEQRRELARKGHALPDGSYPIDNREDLENAARLAASGHGNVAAAKRLIKRRAKELGVKVSSLPGMGKKAARESTPLTLREAVAAGELSPLDALAAQQDERVPLLDRLGIDRDYLDV